ncbi:A/G-specific adenine glycosylase [Thermoactinomyces mirandus]|uniref:Adenine DNA glycosylase n=1 Tax=Thermoactinomyces mirandus TaxID=2756294 RepID=A0A7W1XPU0_9BACL|nr:A/G-specific adenine glycosylase [Thermoactinomyces mirandus]MBA4601077.1 A/G-specific adenine glycosylase [Thermoactinomyces mirandus]
MPKSNTNEMPRLLKQDQAQTIQRELLAWYNKNKRNLPWRQNKDPYKIWVSEIMLQQTRVDSVIPYFQRFIERFPSIEDLANAPEEQVIKAWEGLGYYSRAKNLHAAAKEIVFNGDGKIPSDRKSILKLKGIGSYTAGAILSIAYGKKVPAVDGNVMRVFSRLFALADDIHSSSTRKKMESIAEQLIPEENPGDFNQALMELGALICTPASPTCLFCPVRSVCDAYEQGIEEQLPRKKKAKPPVQQDVVIGFFRYREQFIGEKRPDQGLLAGLWGFPTFELSPGEDPLQKIKNFCDQKQIPGSKYIIKGKFKHVFSHRHWKVDVVQVDVKHPSFSLPATWEWMGIGQKEEKTWANVYQKVFKLE